VKWELGKLTELKITSLLGNPVKIMYSNSVVQFETEKNQELLLDAAMEIKN
jgi:hypothetical protein